MKTTNLLLIGAAGLGVWYYTGLGVSTGTLNLVFSGVKLNSINDWSVILTVQNVGNTALVVNSMSGNILLNNEQLGNISDFTKRTIPGNSQADVEVHIKPQLFNLSSQLQNIINNRNAPLAFNINGNVNVNNLVLPFSLDYNFSLS